MNTRILAAVAVAAAYVVGVASLGLILAGTISLVNLSTAGMKLRVEQSQDARAAIEDTMSTGNAHTAVVAALN